jgi:hypothetical protein
LARKPRTRKVAAKPSGEDLESLLEMVRSLWNATEQADAAVRDWSQKAIVDGIARLNRQVTSKLRLAAAIPPAQPRLFSEERELQAGSVRGSGAGLLRAVSPRFPEPKLRIYAKALAKQALNSFPTLVDSLISMPTASIWRRRCHSTPVRRSDAMPVT